MGSFRLAVSTLHLHRTFNFTKLVPETVKKSLHHSCTSSIKWQGISLLLRSSGIGPSFTECYKKNINLFIFIISTGQVSDSIHTFTIFAESCVFDKQLLLPALFHYLYLLTLINNTPSPEVTKSFCRVPSILFP